MVLSFSPPSTFVFPFFGAVHLSSTHGTQLLETIVKASLQFLSELVGTQAGVNYGEAG